MFLSISKFILSVMIVLGISACGYSPSAKNARTVMGDKISTNVIISLQDPQNTVIIKDALDKSIIEVFQASLVPKDRSDTHLTLSMGMPRYTPVVYDLNGFVTGYRMTVSLSIKSYHDGVSKNYTTRGNYDFTVAPNAIVTDQERLEAIGFATVKAIRAFVAQVSAEGARANK